MTIQYNRVRSELYSCGRLSCDNAALDAIAILRDSGASFWSAAPRFCQDEPELDVDEETRDYLGGIIHPKLPMSYVGLRGDINPTGFREAQVTVDGKYRWLWLQCNSFAPDLKRSDEIVDELSTFTESMIAVLQPEYGWIDAAGENAPGIRSIQGTEVRYVFWNNVFGPKFVQKYGRSFLLKAPVWRAIDLGECGVSLTVCQNFHEWIEESFEDVLIYFRQKCPDVRQFSK